MMKNAQIFALQGLLFERVLIMIHGYNHNKFCFKVANKNEGCMLRYNFWSGIYVMLSILKNTAIFLISNFYFC